MRLLHRKFYKNLDLIPDELLKVRVEPFVVLESEKPVKSKGKVTVSFWSIVAASAVMVLVYPFLPLMIYSFMGSGVNLEESSQAPLLGKFELNPQASGENNSIQNLSNAQASIVTDPQMRQEDRIVIPKIGVNIKIISTENEDEALSQGSWRFPQTSTPDQGSNSAFSAHRYKYLPPHSETFYLLDKLEMGDTFSVFWKGKEYIYRVNNIMIVSPYTVEVLDPTQKSIVTLVTCNPLFSTKERLIVQGELVGVI